MPHSGSLFCGHWCMLSLFKPGNRKANYTRVWEQPKLHIITNICFTAQHFNYVTILSWQKHKTSRFPFWEQYKTPEGKEDTVPTATRVPSQDTIWNIRKVTHPKWRDKINRLNCVPLFRTKPVLNIEAIHHDIIDAKFFRAPINAQLCNPDMPKACVITSLSTQFIYSYL